MIAFIGDSLFSVALFLFSPIFFIMAAVAFSGGSGFPKMATVFIALIGTPIWIPIAFVVAFFAVGFVLILLELLGIEYSARKIGMIGWAAVYLVLALFAFWVSRLGQYFKMS